MLMSGLTSAKLMRHCVFGCWARSRGRSTCTFRACRVNGGDDKLGKPGVLQVFSSRIRLKWLCLVLGAV